MSVTTGVCAAAAAKAAAIALYQDKKIETVEVTLPTGKNASLPTKIVRQEADLAKSCVQKPANDDPDITQNIRIFAEAQKLVQGSGFRVQGKERIKIEAGEGIGMATKPGLAIAVREPAINPTPLKMIKDEVTKVLPKNNSVKITISAPEGKKLADKTFNARLGIVGGISILGTTGLVKPMSVNAYKVTISQQIDMAKAAGHNHLIITPGNIGQKAALRRGFDPESIIVCSNFIGFALKESALKNIKEITLVGHLGKLLKILDGHFDTHSQKAPLNLELLAPFLSAEKISKLNSAEEAIKLLTKKQLNEIAELINQRVVEYTSKSIVHGQWSMEKTNTSIINLKSEIVGSSNE